MAILERILGIIPPVLIIVGAGYGYARLRGKSVQADMTAVNACVIPNLAIFGRPIEERKIEVQCVNKLILNRVGYDFHFGPVGL